MTAAVLAVRLIGCSSEPGEPQLRALLVRQVREDIARYNQRMDRYPPPVPEMDGSSFSTVRSRLELAVKASGMRIRRTGGRTTLYEAEVPHIIISHIKTGLTVQDCAVAPERELPPQRVVYKYQYDSVTRKWRRAPGRVGGRLGFG